MVSTKVVQNQPHNVFLANNVNAEVGTLTLISARSISAEGGWHIGAMFGELPVEISIIDNRLDCIFVGALQLCFAGEGLIIKPVDSAKVVNKKRPRKPNKEDEIESLFEEVPFT